MDIDKVDNNCEQEWQWCLVGNIVEEHEYGEEHVIKYGNRQFRPNAKVFINLVYGGMGHESVLVIGLPRHSKKYIEIVIARKYICNFRMQKVFKPAVLNRMKNSKWDWWGNTEESRDDIICALEWLNPDEAAKEKDKLPNWEGKKIIPPLQNEQLYLLRKKVNELLTMLDTYGISETENFRFALKMISGNIEHCIMNDFDEIEKYSEWIYQNWRTACVGKYGMGNWYLNMSDVTQKGERNQLFEEAALSVERILGTNYLVFCKDTMFRRDI